MDWWTKPSFTVIGMEGSTLDGEGFIQTLWEQANSRFSEVASLAQRDSTGGLVAAWGAMTDFSRSFQPWENGFTQGLYLAGVECIDGAQAPKGWTSWKVPAFRYLRLENDGNAAFARGLELLRTQGIPLAGAVQEMTDPQSGAAYLCFPVERLTEKA